MTSTCPSCGCEQGAGLLCANETDRLERDLGDVASIVADLDITLSRQDNVPIGGIQQRHKADTDDAGSVSPIAHEQNPIKFAAVRAADELKASLTKWATHITGNTYRRPDATKAAARALLSNIKEIRRDEQVAALANGVGKAISLARAAIDHPRNRTVIFVGPCPEDDLNGQPCPGDIDAYVPSSDDRPAHMQCRHDPEHRYTTIQWMRAGRRILNRIDEQREGAA